MMPIAALRMRTPAGAAPFSIGATGTGVSNNNYGANNMLGIAFQASSSGTLKSLHVLGSSAAANTGEFRLVVYAATDANTWGSKLAETPIQDALGLSEQRDLPLDSNVTITAGNWYALCVHPGATLALRNASASNGRLYSDTFSDGANATASATSNNGAYPVLWGTDDVVSLASGSFTIGQRARTADSSRGGNFIFGRKYVSNKTGTIANLAIEGSSTTSSSIAFRLSIYDASGNKLGETAEQTGLGVGQVKTVALISSVSVTAGTYYIICMQAASSMAVATTADTGQYKAQTYSSGAPTSFTFTGDNGPNPKIWATT